MVRGFDAQVFQAIADLVTPYSTGTINFNTAPREVLAAMLPDLSSANLDELLQYRILTPFNSPKEVSDYVNGFVKTDPSILKYFGVASSYFTIDSTASLLPSSDDGAPQAENLKVLHAVVQRTGSNTTLKYWRAT